VEHLLHAAIVLLKAVALVRPPMEPHWCVWLFLYNVVCNTPPTAAGGGCTNCVVAASVRTPVLCCAVLCCAVLCCAVLCCAVLCCAVL
jgi:hypothetical protein